MSRSYYRRQANRFLLASCLLFLFFAFIRHYAGNEIPPFWTDLFYHVTQAALIGGLADWFAVTALFEKPLGIPWHTAIIPRNRRKLIDGLARTVETDWLNQQKLISALERIRFSTYVIALLEKKQSRQKLLSFVRQRLQRELLRQDSTALSRRWLPRLRSFLARRPLRKLVAYWLHPEREDRWLRFFLSRLEEYIRSPQTQQSLTRLLQRLVEHKKGGSSLSLLAIQMAEDTGSLSPADFIIAFRQNTLQLLSALHNRDHTIRRWLRLQMLCQVRRLRQDPDYAAMLSLWQQRFTDSLSLNQPLETFLEQLLHKQLLPPSPLLTALLRPLARAWEDFKNNPDSQARLDYHLQQWSVQLLSAHPTFVGDVVRDALTALSDKDMTRFVEDKVGDDLTWIRINGCLIGGAAGLLLFLFSQLLYKPLVLGLPFPFLGQ